MPYFSESDINEAKRRVREMQSRASSFTESRAPKAEKEKEQTPPHFETKKSDEGVIKEDKREGSDSSLFIILALILLLSKEEADNSLILALLYLLL